MIEDKKEILYERLFERLKELLNKSVTLYVKAIDAEYTTEAKIISVDWYDLIEFTVQFPGDNYKRTYYITYLGFTAKFTKKTFTAECIYAGALMKFKISS